MHDLHLLADFSVIVAISVVVVWLFHKIKLPSLVGFLVAGALIGPGGFGLIESRGEIDLLAEIGVVLLLFSIGLEFSLKQLWKIRRLVFGGGGLQMLVTGTIVTGAAIWAGFDANIAILFGALVALSSTAIVLNLLQKSGELDAVHGQGMLGVLIFQDLAVVVLILLVPLLAGESSGAVEVALVLAKALGVVVGMWVAASYIFPWVLERVVKTRQRELFTLVTILAAIGTAYIAGLAGLSLALGSFLAGLIISESPYSHQMLSEVLPFRDLFNSIFFVSVGMLFQPAIFGEMPLELLGLILAAFTLKALVAGGAIYVLGYGIRVAVLVGLGLAQIGEFAFVLANEALRVDLLEPKQYSIFLGVSVVTMASTPLLMKLADILARRLEGRMPGAVEQTLAKTHQGEELGGKDAHLSEHVIVVGYGLNGRNVARVLRHQGVPFVVLEMNPNTVRACEEHMPIYYGDATRHPVLEHFDLKHARALVVAIGDAATTRRIVAQAHEMNPDMSIIVRTRYVSEMNDLYDLGASEVIPEEYETSLALVGSVLETYGVGATEILAEKELIRGDAYESLRK